MPCSYHSLSNFLFIFYVYVRVCVYLRTSTACHSFSVRPICICRWNICSNRKNAKNCMRQQQEQLKSYFLRGHAIWWKTFPLTLSIFSRVYYFRNLRTFIVTLVFLLTLPLYFPAPHDLLSTHPNPTFKKKNSISYSTSNSAHSKRRHISAFLLIPFLYAYILSWFLIPKIISQFQMLLLQSSWKLSCLWWDKMYTWLMQF